MNTRHYLNIATTLGLIVLLYSNHKTYDISLNAEQHTYWVKVHQLSSWAVTLLIASTIYLQYSVKKD